MRFKRLIAAASALCISMCGLCMPVMAEDKVTVYIAGDSTACQYGEDENYALPRAGWGMYIGNFLYGVEIKNCAKSGRSSKSLTAEAEYKEIFDNIKEGDYLLIQFGHNDAKNSSQEDIEKRYTSPQGDKDTEGSFKNSLYVNYIKPAQEKGATPILLTPISRRKFGEDGKVTDSHGIYDDDVRELAEELGLVCIDLTEATAEFYNAYGEEGTKAYHAIFKDAAKGENGFDNTHLNHYGAEYVAAMAAKELWDKDKDGLGQYVSGVDKMIDFAGGDISRGEYTARLVRLLGIESKSESNDSFPDVKTEDKNSAAIAAAKAAGIVNGNEKGLFMPEELLTVQDAAVITARALEYVCALKIDGSKPSFEGAQLAKPYAVPALNTLSAEGIIEDWGFPDAWISYDATSRILARAYEAKTVADKISSQEEMSLDELEKVE